MMMMSDSEHLFMYPMAICIDCFCKKCPFWSFARFLIGVLLFYYFMRFFILRLLLSRMSSLWILSPSRGVCSSGVGCWALLFSFSAWGVGAKGSPLGAVLCQSQRWGDAGRTLAVTFCVAGLGLCPPLGCRSFLLFSGALPERPGSAGSG